MLPASSPINTFLVPVVKAFAALYPIATLSSPSVKAAKISIPSPVFPSAEFRVPVVLSPIISELVKFVPPSLCVGPPETLAKLKVPLPFVLRTWPLEPSDTFNWSMPIWLSSICCVNTALFAICIVATEPVAISLDVTWLAAICVLVTEFPASSVAETEFTASFAFVTWSSPICIVSIEPVTNSLESTEFAAISADPTAFAPSMNTIKSVSEPGAFESVNAVVEPSPLNELWLNAPPVVTLDKLFTSTLVPFGGAALNVTVEPDTEYAPFSW